jgi:hypothetical protein
MPLRYADDEPPKSAAPEPEVKSEPVALAATNGESSNEHPEQNGAGDEQAYNGEEDMDDEIDFNLGGNGNNYEAPAAHELHGPGIKEDG